LEPDLQRAFDLAYRQVARADRTVSQVRRHLAAKDVEPEAIGEVVQVLREQGYLDDARYARRFSEDRRSLDGWGPRRIEQRLLAAGVDPEIVAVAVQRSPEAELDAAVALLRRRLCAPPADNRERDRALGLLLRRGYDFEVARDAIAVHRRGESHSLGRS
jgi:regulatory protein